MKKTFCILLVLILALSLMACGDDKGESSEEIMSPYVRALQSNSEDVS
jgi:uncharacterized lipoprotein YehR (DUF1307 family)